MFSTSPRMGTFTLLVHVHVDALARIGECDLLRCGDDDGSCDAEGLDEGEVNVAGARRGVEDEVVEFAPLRFGDELLEGVACHTATPQGGLVGIDKEADGEQFHAVFLDGHDEVATIYLLCVWALFFHTKHLGHGGTEDVGVEQSHTIAQLGQSDGEVGGDGRFAHTSLA